MKLAVLILGQRDIRWANQRLGTVNGTTIGGYGCIITCISMLANYFGHPIAPDQMDNWLTANQGYTDDSGVYFSPSPNCNLYLNTAFRREFSDCSFDHAVFCKDTPAPLDEIDWFINHGFPVVVEVDFNHDPADGVQTHFILIVGKTDDGRYIANDPWFGDECFVNARYGDPATSILQVNYFVGTVAVKAIPVVPAPITFTPVVDNPSGSASLSPSASPSEPPDPSDTEMPIPPVIPKSPDLLTQFFNWLIRFFHII